MKDSLRESTVDWIKRFTPSFLSGAKEAQQVVVRQVTASDGPMAPAGFAAGRLFVSVAGISGVLAVGLGAYGAHVLRPGHQQEHLKLAFETGSRYHFFHTLALLGAPLTRRPNLFGSLLCLGMLLFSGSCYYYALTESDAIRKVTPYGETQQQGSK